VSKGRTGQTILNGTRIEINLATPVKGFWHAGLGLRYRRARGKRHKTSGGEIE